ncbi:MAG: hypothetical protein ACYCTV_09450 [Leptospirales bacterium]
MEVAEGGFLFDFSRSLAWERFDLMGRPVPQGMSLVDFLVEEPERLILIEVKDPFPPPGRGDLFQKRSKGSVWPEGEGFRMDRLIHQSLVPKMRDSYTYLHLMGRDTKPVLYVVLLGLDRILQRFDLLVVIKDRLLSRLGQEGHLPWKRPYVRNCLVLDPAGWRTAFPEYPLVRVQTDGVEDEHIMKF